MGNAAGCVMYLKLPVPVLLSIFISIVSLLILFNLSALKSREGKKNNRILHFDGNVNPMIERQYWHNFKRSLNEAVGK